MSRPNIIGRSLLRLAVFFAPMLMAAAAHAEGADDHLFGCRMYQGEMKERCEATAANFRETYALAMRGDYEGLMNAGAFMLETPDAHWPIKQDALLGCTWSLVAIASGSPKVNTGEVKIYEGRCVRDRSPTERAVIRQQATQLYQQLYGRPLPPDFYYAVRLPRSCSRAKFPASLMRANSIYLASLQKRGGSVVRRRPPKPAQAFSM